MALPPNPNTFANNPLERASYRRTDDEWVKAHLKEPNSRIVPLWRQQPFVLPPEKPGQSTDVGWLRPGLLDDVVGEAATTIFLGLNSDGIAHFAVDISHIRNPANEGPLAGFGEFKDLRSIAMDLPADDAAILAQAKALLTWHETHRFCSKCGAESVMAEAGYRRDCPDCGGQHFPRTDPVVIMLATYGEKALLGRQSAWPPHMYSALAGFVESGESIEEAVARELREEAHCSVRDVRYHSTQPWPYPMSLMIGCIAESVDGKAEADGVEIESAEWFTREELKAVLENRGDGKLWVPPPLAIAHQLIRSWVYEDD